MMMVITTAYILLLFLPGPPLTEPLPPARAPGIILVGTLCQPGIRPEGQVNEVQGRAEEKRHPHHVAGDEERDIQIRLLVLENRIVRHLRDPRKVPFAQAQHGNEEHEGDRKERHHGLTHPAHRPIPLRLGDPGGDG
jgi:hypothetical protein